MSHKVGTIEAPMNWNLCQNIFNQRISLHISNTNPIAYMEPPTRRRANVFDLGSGRFQR